MHADRRELLVWSALTAGFELAPFGVRFAPFCVRFAPFRVRFAPGDEIDELVRWIVATPREPALQRGARELAAGLAPSRLLGALQVAAAREIRTDRPRFNHDALVVSSVDQLSGTATQGEQRALALWCLDHFKESQESEAQSEDWKMAPVDARELPQGAAARAALIDALERWDPSAADVAIAGWVRSAALDEIYAVVWEYGLRCQSNLGHKAIYAALSRRALPLGGEKHVEDVLRSVVNSFFLGGKSESASAFERSRDAVARAFGEKGETADARRTSPLMGGGGRGRGDASPASGPDLGAARELLHSLRTLAPAEVPSATAQLARAGADPATLWDALLIGAAEISVEDPGVAPLHALTSINSLHHIALDTPSDRIALLALLQAAAWTCAFHARGPTTLRLDELEPVEARPDEVLGAPESSSLDVARRALWVGARDAQRFAKQALATVRTRADDVHELKLAAAAIEEAGRAGAWARPAVIAALAVHQPRRTDSPRLADIRGALAIAEK